MATPKQRLHLFTLMRYTLAHEALIHYAQQRPMDLVRMTEKQLRARFKAGKSISMDCSEGVTALAHWTGLLDPNGNHYNGYGWTKTLLDHLPHYADQRRAKVGALCVFGPYPGDHVAMVFETGSDPLMWSHGGEHGPVKVRWSAERSYHRPPATFLSIAGL